jgi:hypothetical protein
MSLMIMIMNQMLIISFPIFSIEYGLQKDEEALLQPSAPEAAEERAKASASHRARVPAAFFA